MTDTARKDECLQISPFNLITFISASLTDYITIALRHQSDFLRYKSYIGPTCNLIVSLFVSVKIHCFIVEMSAV